MSIENPQKPGEIESEKSEKELHGEQRELSDAELGEVSGGMVELE